MRILGLDPGLRATGWGVIDAPGNRLAFVACGAIHPARDGALAQRLAALYVELRKLIAAYAPDEAVVEATFVSRNGASTLKLGQARGVVLLAPALAGLPVAEYAAKEIKKALVGRGDAEKVQVAAMVRALLRTPTAVEGDAADALAAAVCHAHTGSTRARWAAGGRAR